LSEVMSDFFPVERLEGTISKTVEEDEDNS
jgi:hypothetical protein